MFGLLWGTLLASFASSVGATAAFLIARLLLRDWVQSRFGDSLAPINAGIKKDGEFYLFSLRMVPLFPFFFGKSGDGSDANSRAIVLLHQSAGHVDGNGGLRQRRSGNSSNQFTVRLGERACSCLTGPARRVSSDRKSDR